MHQLVTISLLPVALGWLCIMWLLCHESTARDRSIQGTAASLMAFSLGMLAVMEVVSR